MNATDTPEHSSVEDLQGPDETRNSPTSPAAASDVPAGLWLRLRALRIDAIDLIWNWRPLNRALAWLIGATGKYAIVTEVVIGVLGLIWVWLYYEQIIKHAGWIVAVAVFGYRALTQATSGQTPGHLALGLRVVGNRRPLTTSRSLLRNALALGLLLSGFGVIPLLIPMLRADRRGLHDLIAGTRVIRT